MGPNGFRFRARFRLSAARFMALAALLFPGERIFATPQLTPSQRDDEGCTLIYVPNVSGGITEINSAGSVVFGTAPWIHGSNGGIAITPDGSKLFVSNHEVSSVSVFDTATNVPLMEIGVGLNPIGLAITPDGSHAYVANQNSDNVSVIALATNTVINTIPMGAGADPIWVTISPDGSRAYVSNQYGDTISVIDTASNTVLTNVAIGFLPFHSTFARDGRFLWVSVQGENVVKVVDTNSNTVVGSIPAGPNPRGIAFTYDGSRAYVADFDSNTVAVIDVLGRSLTGFVTVGNSPWNLGITPKGIAYAANFADNTISVFDTSTNLVTATLHARQGPADVLVNTTARPRVLRYSFHSIAPAGSPYSLVRALNDQGDAVGDFLDANFGFHGFLRTHGGAFQSIDPPGAQATSAFAVNDLGEIVGAYIDSAGSLHGFRQSPSGTYTTVDFPGAPDSQLTGINNLGQSSGVFDLGNRASTRCPGPTCQAIGFLLRAGQFTSFQDPVAVPGVTFAQSINDLGQIAGLFQDPAGNVKGFLRSPAEGIFRTIQFPFADAFSYVEQINDLGVMAGQYRISFVDQGFLTDRTHVLSVDFPNSAASGLRAVNNLGVVGGFFSSASGGPIEAYIATPREVAFPFADD
jgi:YVTN family beta-propeller protein